MQNETLAQAFLRSVHEDLAQIKQPHFDIAFRLHEAKQYKYSEDLGYKDIYELSETEFGVKRSSTAAYIAICEEFMSVNGVPRYSKYVSAPWNQFSFSQLVEMLPMDEYDRCKITPDMTVKQIREWRRDHKFVTLSNGDCVLYGELSEKQRKDYEDFKVRQKEEKQSVQTSGQYDRKVVERLSLLLCEIIPKCILPNGFPHWDTVAMYLLDHGVKL